MPSAVGEAANRRLCDAEAAQPAPNVATFSQVTQPSTTDDSLYAPGLRFGVERVMVIRKIPNASRLRRGQQWLFVADDRVLRTLFEFVMTALVQNLKSMALPAAISGMLAARTSPPGSPISPPLSSGKPSDAE
jgi:hypothetical protein